MKHFILTHAIMLCMLIPSYGQNENLLTLKEILVDRCLMASEARMLNLSTKQSQLDINNFNLRKLPVITFYFDPVNYTQSIVSLQDPLTGNFNYTNSFVNNSSLGISVGVPINITGGNIQLYSSLNMMNQFSLDKNSFSSTPLRISYSQTFIGGGKKYRLDKEINQLKEFNLSKIEKYNLYSIQKHCVELYMNLLVNDMSLTNSKINLAIADSIYIIAQIKQSINAITEQDYLQASIQNEQSKIDLINKEMQRDKALRSLLLYLNMEYQQYKVEIPYRTFTDYISPDKVVRDASFNNPNIIDWEIEVKEAYHDVYNAKIQKRFNGDISLSYGLNQFGENLLLAYQHPSKQQSISIGVQIPIIDWGIRKNNYQKAKFQYESVQLGTEKEREQFIDALRNMVDEYNYSMRTVDIAKRQSDLSFRQFKLSIQLFATGQNTFLEMATARNQYLEAEKSFQSQLSQSWINYYTIRNITLTEY